MKGTAVRSARQAAQGAVETTRHLASSSGGLSVRLPVPTSGLLIVRQSDTYDLGSEPPIEAEEGRHASTDRRRVSIRWLAGIVMTGLTGAALIGAAIYIAFDREYNFAEGPTPALPPKRDAGAEPGINTRKGDRLLPAVDIVAAKQTYHAPTTVRIGDKELVRSRSFTRVSTTLALGPTGFANEVPDFDPIKLVTGERGGAEAVAEAAPVQDDAEVSFVTREAASADPASFAGDLTFDEVQAQVTEHVKNSLASGSKAPLPIPPQLLLIRTSHASLNPLNGLNYASPDFAAPTSPFSSIEVKLVRENVSQIPKALPVPLQPNQGGERLVVLRHGETLDDVLRANGASKDQARAIVAAFGSKRGAAPVAEGQKLKLLLTDLDGAGKSLEIARVSAYEDDKLAAMVAVTDKRNYLQVALAGPVVRPVRRAAAGDGEDDSGGMRLYDSLYETALKQEIPKPVIDTLVRIFGNDLDFQRSVAGGDSFEAFYQDGEESEGRNELLYAAITTRSETFKYYRFQTRDDGLVDYYDDAGRSVRKFLIRKPITAGELRSGFGMRFHPILHYTRLHSGVDWSNAIGTPILAAGNGTIIKLRRESGYGNRIEIQHPYGYITTYSHMSAFARGMDEGGRVRQGQVIGFLGQTGLATGPHLHYEVMVNGNFVDPMRVKLARTREFDGKLLTDFKRERERIDGLMALAPNATHVAAKLPN